MNLRYNARLLARGFVFFCLLFTLSCQKSVPVASPSPLAPVPLATPARTPAPSWDIKVEKDKVFLTLPWSGARVWRSYSGGIEHPRALKVELPVDGGQVVDAKPPSGILLYYTARGPQSQEIVMTATIPNHALPPLTSPTLVVDKANRTLEVVDRGEVQKRYPVALGAKPMNRKICQDMASTPEGWYRVYAMQPEATYHKALDIDYPRSEDYLRHELARQNGAIEKDVPIGGEIQIHGWGVPLDWTAGCIALRDDDMDELFANPGIQTGIPVFIAGGQITRDDMEWLRSPPEDKVRRVQERLAHAGFYNSAVDGRFGTETARALGHYQAKKGLPVSCQLDGVTRRHFSL